MAGRIISAHAGEIITNSRRDFIRNMTLGTAGLAMGSFGSVRKSISAEDQEKRS